MCPHRLTRLHASKAAPLWADFPPDTKDAAVVVGAGIAGLACALGLHKVGIRVIVLERHPELLTQGSSITLWPNAFRALDALACGSGAFQELRDSFGAVKQTKIMDPRGAVFKEFSFEDFLGPGRDSETRCVRRNTLLECLAKDLPPGTIFFDCAVEGVETTETGATLRLRSGQALAAKLVVGAEGASSPLSKALGLKDTVYRGYASIRGVTPAAAAQACGAMQPDVLQFVWGSAVRCGVINMGPEHVYWFIAFNSPKEERPRSQEEIREEALRAVAGWGFPMEALVRGAPLEKLTRNRIFDRQPEAGKAYGRGCLTLCGDAHHASSPNLAQGGCAALEDAVEFTRILRTAIGGSVGGSGPAFAAASPATIEAALREYERHRSPRVAHIVSKSAWTGWIGQSTLWPVMLFRAFYVRFLLSGDGFLSHVHYDPGQL